MLKKLLPDNIDAKKLEIWSEDKTRVGQQGSLTRIWAKKGTRPRKVKQRQFISIYLYEAACHKTGQAYAAVLPYSNTKAMNIFLQVLSKEIKEGKIVRLHVPLRTSKNVYFYLWEKKQEYCFHLEVGKYYFVDVTAAHAVHNKADFDRLHLVIDCYNNPRLENLLKQAEEFDDISSPIGF